MFLFVIPLCFMSFNVIIFNVTKTNDFKGVPHPLSGDYTPKPQEEIDDSLYVYGKKGPKKPKISVSDDNSSEHSTCQSNDSEGSCGNTSEHSFETEHSLVQGLVTPSTTKVYASGEEQVEDISPNTLEAAKTLSRVASLKPK
ncbi:hypothetical protein Tco_0354536, partial [Tanacetum coccineum]